MEKQFCNQPEIWGGIECTINRIHNEFFDQCHYSGHYNRSNDILEIAKLGISKLRYPVLWEKHQPAKNQQIDWRYMENRLNQIRSQGIDVIAGLVHHGSGPSFTNLADPEFPSLLANYAKQVALQFPWIEYYTPVNEPLTTARFSGLYGLWYPHKKNSAAFFKMLWHQLKGTALAMEEIRKINPAAKLVLTEDLGKTYSTNKLKYQAEMENERRWLSLDIMCGRFNEAHPLWNHFYKFIDQEEIHYFIENPCVPQVAGFNHYLTSERYLDENLSAYPEHTHGGNGKHQYADVEAVRVEIEEETGIEVLLEEAWERYHLPMAVTEVHLHCHREEQIKWFRHVFESSKKLINKGIDLKAITSWAILGSYGWNKLLTEPGGDYEPGAFDLSSGQLRPTALAGFIKQITQSNACNHDHSSGKGWWQRSSRILYGPVIKHVRMKEKNTPPLLIIGKNGTLGMAFARICESRCIPYKLVSRKECDISQQNQIEYLVETLNPWAIMNAAGFVRVDDAEKECDQCYKDNVYGPANLASVTRNRNIKLVSFSSDLVFDGQKSKPYIESDKVNPLNVYGKSKAESEIRVLENNAGSLVIRTSAFFGPWDEYNFVHYIRKSLLNGERIKVASDQYISPTYVPDLVHSTLDLVIDDEKGIWHLANKGSLTWSDFALQVAEGFGLNSKLIIPVRSSALQYPAARPGYSVLGSERGQLLPSLENAMERYIHEMRSDNKKMAMTA